MSKVSSKETDNQPIDAPQRNRMSSRKDTSSLCALRKLHRYKILAQYRRISKALGDATTTEAPAKNVTGSTTITAHRCSSQVSIRKRNSSDLWVLRKQQRYQLLACYRRISGSVEDDEEVKPAAQTDSEAAQTRDSNTCTSEAAETHGSHRRATTSMDLWALRKYRRYELLANFRKIPDSLDEEDDVSKAKPTIGTTQNSNPGSCTSGDPDMRGANRRATVSMDLQALRKYRRSELLARYRRIYDSVEDTEMTNEEKEDGSKPKKDNGATENKEQNRIVLFKRRMTDELSHLSRRRNSDSAPKRNSSDMWANRRHEQRAQYRRTLNSPEIQGDNVQCLFAALQRRGSQGDTGVSTARQEPQTSRNTGKQVARRQWIAGRQRNQGSTQDNNFFRARAWQRYPRYQRFTNPRPTWYNRPAYQADYYHHRPLDATFYRNTSCAGFTQRQHTGNFCCHCKDQGKRTNYYNYQQRFTPRRNHRGKFNNEHRRRSPNNLSSSGNLPQQRDNRARISSGPQTGHQLTTKVQQSSPKVPDAMSALTLAMSNITF